MIDNDKMRFSNPIKTIKEVLSEYSGKLLALLDQYQKNKNIRFFLNISLFVLIIFDMLLIALITTRYDNEKGSYVFLIVSIAISIIITVFILYRLFSTEYKKQRLIKLNLIVLIALIEKVINIASQYEINLVEDDISRIELNLRISEVEGILQLVKAIAKVGPSEELSKDIDVGEYEFKKTFIDSIKGMGSISYTGLYRSLKDKIIFKIKTKNKQYIIIAHYISSFRTSHFPSEQLEAYFNDVMRSNVPHIIATNIQSLTQKASESLKNYNSQFDYPRLFIVSFSKKSELIYKLREIIY